MENSLTDKVFLQYYAQLDESQKKSLLQMIKSFLKKDDNAILQTDIEAYSMELQEAEAAFERGEFITHDSMMKKIEKW